MAKTFFVGQRPAPKQMKTLASFQAGGTYLSRVMALWTFCRCVMALRCYGSILRCLCYGVIVLWTRQDPRVLWCYGPRPQELITLHGVEKKWCSELRTVVHPRISYISSPPNALGQIHQYFDFDRPVRALFIFTHLCSPVQATIAFLQYFPMSRTSPAALCPRGWVVAS